MKIAEKASMNEAKVARMLKSGEAENLVAFANRLQLAKCEKTKELFGCNFIFDMEPPY